MDATEPTNDLTLGQLADALVGVESTDLLLARVEQLVARLDALPARLWLIDTGSMVFYPVAGFGCSRKVDDIDATPILMDPGPAHLLLHHQGDPIGLLELVDAAHEPPLLLEQMAAILGPTLMGVNHHEQTLRELRQMHLQLDRLTAAGRLLQHLDIEVLLTEIMQCILETVQAQVGAILVVDDTSGKLQVQVAWGLDEEHIDAIRTRSGDRLADAVLESGQNLRIKANRIDRELDSSELSASLTGILALPLASNERKHGVVLLANPENSFTQEDERLVDVVCDMATIALDNLLLVKAKVEGERMQHDLDVARQVQAKMLPDGSHEQGPLSVAGISMPSEETGGDYFTWIERGGHLVTLIGDVTGHGLGAALFTTIAHAMVQYQFRSDNDLKHALEALNQGLYHTRSGRFMTGAVVDIDPDTLEFSYASAGHNPLCWVSGDTVKWLESSGTPLGIMKSSMVEESETFRLAAGDCLLLYTDGITEAFNPAGEWWGEEALAASLVTAVKAGKQGQAVVDHLLADMHTFVEGRHLADDVTLVVVSVAPAA